MDLLAATGNEHKVREMQEILTPLGINVIGADSVGGIPNVVEDGDTFAANAIKKAIIVARTTKRWVLADDSGLVVDALAGAPGIFSARYAGADADDEKNRQKLLEELGNNTNRKARFVCVIALANPLELIGTAEGEIEGAIVHAPRGSKGFGYDPLFVPQGYTQTFAELAAEVKHSMSHRGRALRKAVANGLFEKYDARTNNQCAVS